MSTQASPRSSEGGIFSRLRRGRSKLSLKDEDFTQSRVSDAERSFDIPPSRAGTINPTPSLSLPLNFSNSSSTTLADDTKISRYLSSQQDERPITAASKVQSPPSRQETRPQRPITPQPARKPVPTSSPLARSATNGVDNSIDRSNNSAEVSSWQSRVVTEMREKENLIERFEALSRVHMALQDEVEKERRRANKFESIVTRKAGSPIAKDERNGISPISAVNGSSASSIAGSEAMKEHDEKMMRDREVLSKQQTDFRKQQTDFQQQQEDLRQAKADIERERTIMQTQRSEMERQKQAHTALLAERDKDKAGHADLESDRAKDREVHASQLTDLQSDHAKDREAHAGQLRDLDTRLATVNASLGSSNAEVERLKEQNQQLRENMAKSSPTVQTTDAEFNELMAALQADVEKWVTNNFRNSRIEFEKLEKQGESKELKLIRQAVPQYKEAAAKSKLLFLQALVSSRLLDSVWDDFFYVAMPDWEEEHETKEESTRGGLGYLREAYKTLSASNSPDFHASRAQTVALLRKTHDPHLTSLTNKLISRIAFSINNLLSSITSSSGALPSRVRDLQAFIGKAIDLSRHFRSQKAVFEFSLPGGVQSSDGLLRTIPYDGFAMQGVDGADSDQDTDRIVLAAVRPLVVKTGAEGMAKGERAVVIKATVMCGAAK